MSAYYPPKNYTPIFDASQFENQEQQYLNFPIAQGTETFNDIIINGSIIIPATPIAYLNQNNIFTGSLNTFNSLSLTTGSTLTLNGTAYIDQSTGTGENILSSIRFNNSTSVKQITLYRNSSTDLASNYTISIDPSTLRYNSGSSGSHIFSYRTGVNTYGNFLTISSAGLTQGIGNYIQSSTSIISQTGTGVNSMKAITMLVDTNLTQSGTGIVSQTGTGVNSMKAITMLVNTNLTQSGTGIVSQTGTGQNILKSTSITDLSVSGTVTLPSASISDSALSSNVPLKNADNVFTGTTNTFNYVDSNTGIGINSGSVLTFADTTNTIFSQINQFNNTLSIANYGTGSIAFTTPSVDLTNTYTYMGGAEMIAGNQFTQYDTTTTYGTALSQSSTNYLIDNQYNSSAIILRNKNASGVAVDHTFAFNGITLNAPVTMGSNLNFTQQGSGNITQASTTSQNLLNPTQFQGDITFTVGSHRIDQTGGGNGAVLRQITMLANFDIIFNAGTGIINQSAGTSGINLLKAITMNANANFLQSGTSILSQSGTGTNTLKAITMLADTNLSMSGTGIISQAGTGTNTLKAITMVAGTNLTQTTTSIIDQSSSTGGINLLKAITMNANANFLQSGSSILSQAGTGINLMKSITMNVDQNILMSGIGIIQQSGTGTNALKGSTFSANNTHFNGASIIQYDSTNAVSTTLRQANTTSYLIENNNNSSDIYLRTKTSTGTSVDYVFAHNGATLNNNVVIPSPSSMVFTAGAGNQTNLGQSTSLFVCWNLTNSGQLVFRTRNATGTADIDGITTSYTGTTINNNLTSNGSNTFTSTNQFNSDLTVLTSGSNYLRLSDGTSSTRQYQSSGDCVIANQKTYSAGFGDIILLTTDTAGSGAERLRVSYNKVKTSVNIELPSPVVTPSSGQLGYIHTGTIVVHSPATTITTNTVYYVASMNLPTGVWNVFGAFSLTPSASGTINETDISISQTFGGTTIDYNNAVVSFNSGTLTTGYYPITRLNTIITNTSVSTALIYLNFKILISSGTFQLNTTSDSYTKFYAVRIA